MPTKELTKAEVYLLYSCYRLYVLTRRTLYKDHSGKCGRTPNFPEDISENIIRYYIHAYEHIKCHWSSTKRGDLIKYIGNTCIQVEVKCFSSDGPISFGPCEQWDELYLLDARTMILDNQIKIYKIQLSNNDILFRRIRVSKTQTFEDQCAQQRRPRITFDKLCQELGVSIVLVYNDKIENIIVNEQ